MRYYVTDWRTNTHEFIKKSTADILLNDETINRAFIIWYEGKDLTIIADEAEDAKRVLQLVRQLTNSHNTARIKRNIYDCCGGFFDEFEAVCI